MHNGYKWLTGLALCGFFIFSGASLIEKNDIDIAQKNIESSQDSRKEAPSPVSSAYYMYIDRNPGEPLSPNNNQTEPQKWAPLYTPLNANLLIMINADANGHPLASRSYLRSVYNIFRINDASG